MRNKNFINKIAITGLIGSGKSTVGLILTKKGINFISTDELAKQAIIPPSTGYHKLLKLMGPEYLTKDHFFDTSKIAKEAFQNGSLLKQIEDIIHPIIQDLMRKKNQELLFSGQHSVFYEVPLLFEKKWEPFFDTYVVIAIDPAKQMKHLKKNRTIDIKDIKNRMRFQMSQEKKIKKANYVIWNNSSLTDLEKQVFSLINLIGVC
ncbi:MAG: dephospho-CoA kinase [Bdellovibrionales bacterium]|nr:dephospho-CoA kinase [Bdellovibrionales bacterium]